MRVATFNANSIRIRLETILRWLEDKQPDILCVQETKVPDDAFPEVDLRAAGYHVAYCGQKSYNGVAVLSRQPPTRVRFGRDDGDTAAEQPAGAETLASHYVRVGCGAKHRACSFHRTLAQSLEDR